MHSYSQNSDVFARKTHAQIELTRKEAIKRNSFGSVNDNRFITADLPKWKAQHEARGR